MNKVNGFKVISGLLLLFILVSCSMQSEEESVENVLEIAEDTFESEELNDPNQELEHTSIYIPDKFQLESEDASNIILKEKEQTYIVFYNSLEPATSEIGADSSRNKEALLFETFEDEKKFGYIRLMPEIDKKYEMVVGIGGVKITTHTTKKDMEQDAEEMMHISKSLVNKNTYNVN